MGQVRGRVPPPRRRGDAGAFFFSAMEKQITSRRSYLERQAQLDRIANVDMPQNRRDIQDAREMGDLSENFEYESARSRERQLIARQERLIAELRDTAIADFAAVDFDGTVKPGTCVTLAYPDGARRTLCILGAWDFDEELGVISCRGRLAEALDGCRKGDVVGIPDPDFDDATLEITVVDVKKPPKKIIDWANNA